MLVAEAGGKLSRVVYLSPPPRVLIVKLLMIISLISNYMNMKLHQIAVIMQVKLSCIPCRSVSYAWLERQGARCPGRFILPPT